MRFVSNSVKSALCVAVVLVVFIRGMFLRQMLRCKQVRYACMCLNGDCCARCWGFIGPTTKRTEGAWMPVTVEHQKFRCTLQTHWDLSERDNTTDYPCLHWQCETGGWAVTCSVVEMDNKSRCAAVGHAELPNSMQTNVSANARALKRWSLQWSQPSVASPWPGVRGWLPTWGRPRRWQPPLTAAGAGRRAEGSDRLGA